MEEAYEFPLSAKESEFLKQLAMADQSVAALLASHVDTDGRRVSVRLTVAEAEQLRDYLTVKLAEIGFDQKYSLTAAGDMLETLIDKFYVP